MDYKEKYEQVLERAKKMYDSAKGLGFNADCVNLEVLFPELAESEDERIRKALLEDFSRMAKFTVSEWGIANRIPVSDIIAWLEKQQDNTIIEQVFRPLAGCCIDTAAKQAVEQQKIGKNVVLAFNGCYIPVENNTVDEIVNKYNAWLKKQGERFSWSEEDEVGLGDALWAIEQARTIAKDENDMGNLWYAEKWLKSLKTKCKGATESTMEIDKNVKPKFKVGDWVTCEELNTVLTVLIVNVESDRYEVEFINGNKGFPHIDYIDETFHLYTIEDAKDGDVLATPKEIFIYNGNYNKYSNVLGAYYSVKHNGGDLFIPEDDEEYRDCVIIGISDATPATKEQRDILEMAITNAGYKWDKEKLKLEKI